MTTSETLKAARAYRTRGLAVFPLNGKVPITEHGVLDAAHDDSFDALFELGHENIGIAIPEGVVVVDVDPRNGGAATFSNWSNEYDMTAFTQAPCAKTGGGGWHYWFKYDGSPLCKAIDGIDFQRIGKYVVAPPSLTVETYRWERTLPASLDDLPEYPSWLLEISRQRERPSIASRPVPYSSGGDELADAAYRHSSWDALLERHGWRNVGGDKWRHPGSDNKFSATLTNDCLFVYSPNTPFPVTEHGDPHGVTLVNAIATLDFRGDYSHMASVFREMGYLPRRATLADLKPPPSRALPPARVDPETGEVDDASIHLNDLTNAELRRVRWLWEDRIPTASLTLLAGREGEGKSTIAIDIIAALTRGELRGEFFDHPRDALIVATEDSIEHTIKPRLLAAGADLKRVFTIEMVDPAGSLSLPVDLPDLERACSKLDVGLIVLDPLLSRLGGNLDSHKDADVRRALEPLGAFADRIQAAILGLIHLNKSGSTDPLQAVMASRAFTAFARSVLFAMVNPDDETQRLLGLVKSNLGPTNLPTLTYSFDPVVVGDDDGPIIATRVVWGSESVVSVQDALLVTNEDKSAVGDAVEWLRDYLDFEGGSCLASAAIKAGRAAAHNDRTLRRAREKLDIVVERTRSAPPVVIWRWPNGPTGSVDKSSAAN